MKIKIFIGIVFTLVTISYPLAAAHKTSGIENFKDGFLANIDPYLMHLNGLNKPTEAPKINCTLTSPSAAKFKVKAFELLGFTLDANILTLEKADELADKICTANIVVVKSFTKIKSPEFSANKPLVEPVNVSIVSSNDVIFISESYAKLIQTEVTTINADFILASYLKFIVVLDKYDMKKNR